MKHFIVICLIIAGIVFLSLRKTDLEVLMKPANKVFAGTNAGNHFVNIDPAMLPMSPQQFVEPGLVTIVYFHYEKCPACNSLDSDLEAFSISRPDVAIRKIAIDPEKDGIEKSIRDFQWPIWSSPTILIYGTKGELIAADERLNNGGQNLLEEWITAELDKARRTSNSPVN